MKEQKASGAAAPRVNEVDPTWPLVQEFLTALRREGLCEGFIREFVGPAKHFLIWLGQQPLAMQEIDETHIRAFLSHDCKCPHPPSTRYLRRGMQSRVFRMYVLRFVWFLEDAGHINNPTRYDDGIARIGDFMVYLGEQGYAPSTIKTFDCCCRHFVLWLRLRHIRLHDVNEVVLRQFAVHDCICPGMFVHGAERFQAYQAKIQKFVRYLASVGVIRSASLIKRPADDHLCAFKNWVRRHRGIGEGSIDRHAMLVARLLPQLGDDPSCYDAALINRVLLHSLENISQEGAKQLCSSLRMYLRFLVATDVCPPGLLGAIPSVPRWRMAALPRYMLSDDVERVIASCNPITHRGLRNRAILLLLARLALRAGDVAHLRLEDIDWNNALIRVSGKTRHEVALPLPQDVGDALLAYIEQARPKVDSDKVFLRVVAPFSPFSHSQAVSCIVSSVLAHAGIDNVNLHGAYLLRHSAATHMLRSGATLEAVGTMLRHRSPETTTIYAKVDTLMLAQVVQPWIGSVSCK